MHFNHFLSSVPPFTSHIQQAALWTKCSTLLTEMSTKSPSFIKCWPGCLNLNTANASQTQRTYYTVSNAHFHIAHPECPPAPVRIDVRLTDTALLATAPLFLAGFWSNWVIPSSVCRRSFKQALILPLSMSGLPTLEFPTCPVPKYTHGNLWRYAKGRLRSYKWKWGALPG